MVTSNDVARLAGVSQATVSRVLANQPTTPEFRRRVLEAVAASGYVANRGARAMRTGRVDTVGVVVADLVNPFYAAIVSTLTEALDARGQKVTLWNTDADGTGTALEAIASASVDGVLFTTVTQSSAPLQAALLRGSPVTLINRIVPGLACDQVSGEDERAAASAAEYLIANGHRRVVVLSGPESASTARDRARGFLDRFHELAPDATAEVRQGPFRHSFGFTAMGEALAQPSPPTAVFCSNDLVAFGAIDAARVAGRAVPDDLWVVGFDDVEMAMWPAFDLTTVHQPSREMAIAGVELLLKRIRNPEAPFEQVRFPSRLVVRGSTANTPVGTSADQRAV